MPYTDSIDKVVQSYFAAVTREPFEYKGKTYEPKTVRVSPGIFRGYTCPAMCGGCCPRFSLDYLPQETWDLMPEARDVLRPRVIEFDRREVLLLSNLQSDVDTHHCSNLDQSNGRCRIHGSQPFTCDFELIRAAISTTDRPHQLTTRLFGRGWAMLRVDGERGALCEIIEVDLDSVADTRRKLHRLWTWARHFELDTKLPEICEWADTGPHRDALTV